MTYSIGIEMKLHDIRLHGAYPLGVNSIFCIPVVLQVNFLFKLLMTEEYQSLPVLSDSAC
jgi:hypothetical protein